LDRFCLNDASLAFARQPDMRWSAEIHQTGASLFTNNIAPEKTRSPKLNHQ